MIVRAWNLGEGNSGAREGLAAPRPVDKVKERGRGEMGKTWAKRWIFT